MRGEVKPAFLERGTRPIIASIALQRALRQTRSLQFRHPLQATTGDARVQRSQPGNQIVGKLASRDYQKIDIAGFGVEMADDVLYSSHIEPARYEEGMAQKHSRLTSEGRLVWFVERLWFLARDLPVRQIPIDQIAEFDQNCWFGPVSPPTCRAVAKHARRIVEADLEYPIILSAQGYLMDGGHRIAKAYLLGMSEVPAVRFPLDPEPDYILAPETPLPVEPRIAVPALDSDSQ